MSEHELDELELAAFRFVAGEMLPDEAAGFEKQLAADEPTREAVCLAVALTEKLVLTAPRKNSSEHRPTVTTPRKPVVFPRVAHALAWMAVGAIAASLVFSWAGTPDPAPDGSLTEQRVADDAGLPRPTPDLFDPHLVDTLAWLEIRDETSWNIDLVWPNEKHVAPDLLSPFNAPTTIPDWMLQTNGDIE